MIDWEDSLFVSARSGKRKVRQFRCQCEDCGESRYLEKRDALRAHARCRNCWQRVKAPMGYRASIAKQGRERTAEIVQNYRLNHPSKLELKVQQWLLDIGVKFVREAVVMTKRRINHVDFLCGNVALEVNGEFAHRNRAQQDAKKWRSLRGKGYRVIVLTEQQVNSGMGLNVLRETFGAMNQVEIEACPW